MGVAASGAFHAWVPELACAVLVDQKAEPVTGWLLKPPTRLLSWSSFTGYTGAQEPGPEACARKLSVRDWPRAVKLRLLNVTVLPTSVPPVLLLTNCIPAGSWSVRV